MSELLSGNVQPQYDTDTGTNNFLNTQGDMGISVQTNRSIAPTEDFVSPSADRNGALPSHQLELEPDDDIVVETGATQVIVSEDQAPRHTLDLASAYARQQKVDVQEIEQIRKENGLNGNREQAITQQESVAANQPDTDSILDRGRRLVSRLIDQINTPLEGISNPKEEDDDKETDTSVKKDSLPVLQAPLQSEPEPLYNGSGITTEDLAAVITNKINSGEENGLVMVTRELLDKQPKPGLTHRLIRAGEKLGILQPGATQEYEDRQVLDQYRKSEAKRLQQDAQKAEQAEKEIAKGTRKLEHQITRLDSEMAQIPRVSLWNNAGALEERIIDEQNAPFYRIDKKAQQKIDEIRLNGVDKKLKRYDEINHKRQTAEDTLQQAAEKEQEMRVTAGTKAFEAQALQRSRDYTAIHIRRQLAGLTAEELLNIAGVTQRQIWQAERKMEASRGRRLTPEEVQFMQQRLIRESKPEELAKRLATRLSMRSTEESWQIGEIKRNTPVAIKSGLYEALTPRQERNRKYLAIADTLAFGALGLLLTASDVGREGRKDR